MHASAAPKASVSMPNSASAHAGPQTYRRPGQHAGRVQTQHAMHSAKVGRDRFLACDPEEIGAAAAPSRIGPMFSSRIPWPRCLRRPVRVSPTTVLFRMTANNGRTDCRNGVTSRRREELSGCWPLALGRVCRRWSPCCGTDSRPLLRISSCSGPVRRCPVGRREAEPTNRSADSW